MNETVTTLFGKRVESSPDKTALCARDGDTWRTITWRAYGARVERFARGLAAAGVAPGDKVALIGDNTPDWFMADMAIMTMGAVSVPVYATSSGEQICHILNHSESNIFIVQEAAYFKRIEDHLDRIPLLQKIVLLNGAPTPDQSIITDRHSFDRLAESIPGKAIRGLGERVTPDMVCTFIYTSGTTGPPKAVMLTHGNCVAAGMNTHRTLHLASGEKVSASYLPLSHVAERVINLYSPLLDGRTVYFMRGFDTFAEDLKEIRPTLWAGVPRVWEKIYEGVMRQRDTLPGIKRKIFNWALKTGSDHNWRKHNREPVSPGLLARYKLARALVLKKLLAGLGLDRVAVAVTGGAPTSDEILDFFVSIDIRLQDVYGQTEGHGTTSFATREEIRFGSAGKPFPLVEIKIAADDEILVKGANVSPGYYKDPEATRQTFKDGWLYSGDLGRLDKDGFLWITGRKKDIIITSGGKNITPSKIEGSLMSSSLVEHAIVVGDGRKYLTALLSINRDEAKILSGKDNGADAIHDEQVGMEIDRLVADVNAKYSRVEQIKRYTLLPNRLSIETGELTHTQKIKKQAVMKKYESHIDMMYQP